MGGSIFSPDWHRVAALRPRFRASVRVERHRHRAQTWYQLIDAGTGRRHRVNEATYRFAGRLDGTCTTETAWQATVQELGDAALTQNDALRVLGQLNHAGVLQCELTPDIERLFRQHHRVVKRRRLTNLNPLSIKVRLFNPARLLALFEPWLPTLFHPLMLAVWLAAVVPALLLAVQHGPELRAFAAAHADAPRYLLIAWLVYPLIKTLHELAHALAVRRWGGSVNEMGFTLLVMAPAPYVDASAASGYPRGRRALVSAVGIMVELFIAALALFVWLNVQPGWVHDIAFVTMLIGAVSTVLFNGNPLLRFDGYHVLCDALDLPNLDQRSRAWWSALIQRRVFAMPMQEQPLAPGERKWLGLYAPLALAYRVYIGLLLALWIATQSAMLGVLVALGVLIGLLAVPVMQLVSAVTQTSDNAARSRSLRILWVGGALLLVAVTLLPLPYGTVAPAVVWLPEQAELRAETDGFVQELKVSDGDVVKPGQVLATLDDPDLQAKQAEAQSRLAALRVQYFNVLQSDRTQAQNFAKALEHAQSEVAHFDARVAQLELKGKSAGRVVLVREQDLDGVFLKKGQALGHVFTPGEAIVRAVVADEDAALVQQRARGASVWMEETPGRPMTARVLRDVPAASFKLPDAGLSDRNGGSVLTDPADSDNLRTLQPFFTVDVALAGQTLERIGGRAWVRFDFGWAPLATQWANALSRLLLKYMEKAV